MSVYCPKLIVTCSPTLASLAPHLTSHTMSRHDLQWLKRRRPYGATGTVFGTLRLSLVRPVGSGACRLSVLVLYRVRQCHLSLCCLPHGMVMVLYAHTNVQGEPCAVLS
jgi:hypothetical protein